MIDEKIVRAELQNIQKYFEAKMDMTIGAGKLKMACWARTCRDALELLKTQQPRVLALDEVKAFNWDYCYLEEERLPGKEYRAVCGDYALTCITWPCVTSMRIQHGDESYGKKWRCWSARPTDEQRKAAAWDLMNGGEMM